MARTLPLSTGPNRMTDIYPTLLQVSSAFGLGGGLTPFLVEIGLIFAIFYFILIRPQSRQRQQHELALKSLKRGDAIVTSGGIVAEVVHIKEGMKDGTAQRTMEDQVTIKSGESRLIVERGRIARIVGSPGATP